MEHFFGVLIVPRPHLRDPKLEQFWRSTLTKWTKSGLNIREFCRKHRLSEPSFYAWRREIAARDGKLVPKPAAALKPTAVPRRSPAPTSRPRPTTPESRRSPTTPACPSFVALRVVADTPLELVLRSGHILRVPPGYDADHLRVVVAVLETQPC